MKLLVIIVTYNAMEWAERCFSSLKNSTVRPDIFVVDNGSTDGTQAFIKTHYPEVMFHQSEENLGFGKANNMGLQYALDHDYGYVYLLNQDAWVMSDTLEQLIALSEKYSDYGILSPFQMNADMETIDRNFVVNVLAWQSNSNILSDIYCQKTKDIYSVTNVMAAHWFMTRECILNVGGFSPSFPHYGEDDNYIDRARYKGFQIGVIPALKVVHDRAGRKETNDSMIYRLYSSSLCVMSNPYMNTIISLIKVFKVALTGSFSYRSLRPIKNLLTILYNIRKIIKNRNISIETSCAFLSSSK